jgi:hypothetical protein
MKIDSQVQAPPQPIQHQQPVKQREQAAEESRQQAQKVQEKQQETRKPEGPVGRNLDVQA